ncbi:hypothetical protein BaRGS_00017428 [Batillaria attramentaria]|uniref:Tudor domain-containing protein n=1 Tax=Batillaria attramentaria TaxID=370345 RepID=A0ABD0KVT5_9CAEN
MLERRRAPPGIRGGSAPSPTSPQPKAGEQQNNIVQPDLDVAPHPAPASHVLTVAPVYVDHDGIIYAHDVTEEDFNTALTAQLDNYVKSEAPEGHLEVKPGQICLAQFAVDGLFYRARILDVDPEAAEVHYIDFGNSAVVLRSQLKLATPELCRIPQRAYQLVLYNIKPNTYDGTWPPPLLHYIHRKVVGFKRTAVIVGSTSSVPLEVALFLGDGRNYIATLMSKIDMKKCYQRSADITTILQHSNPYPQLSVDKVDSLKYAVVTHIELPNLVYLQRHPQDPNETMSQGELRNLERELEDILEFAHQVDDLNNPSPQTPALREVPAIGMMCTAKYSADNRWYRGLVAKAYPATKTALIFYVDYGDTEVVPLQRLRMLPARFQHIPAQAVRAYLNVGLPEGRNRWTVDDFAAMACRVNRSLHAVQIMKTDPLTVELYFPYSDSATLSYQDLIDCGAFLRLPAAESKVSDRPPSAFTESDDSENEDAVSE